MREKLEVQKNISFSPGMKDKVQDAADRFDVSFGEIVRDCVQNYLPRLIERERKRTKRRTK